MMVCSGYWGEKQVNAMNLTIRIGHAGRHFEYKMYLVKCYRYRTCTRIT